MTLKKEIAFKTIAPKLIFYSTCLIFFSIPLGTAIISISGGITLALWFLTGQFLVLKDKDFLKNQRWIWPVIFLFFIPWIALLYSGDRSMGLRFAEKSYYWLFAFVAASLSFYRFPVRYFVKAFIAGLNLYLLYFIFFPSKIIATSKHISFSLLYVCGMFLLSFYYKNTISKKSKVAILALFVVYFIALIFSQGRIGYLAFILLSPIMFFNFLKGRHLTKIILLYLIGLTLLFTSNPVQYRIGLTLRNIKLAQQGNYNTPIGNRLYMWRGAIKIFLHHPVLGAGTGSYKLAMKQYKHNSLVHTHPHNSFLYMAVSFGILGLSILIWLFYILIKTSLHYKDTILGFFILSCTLVILIGSLTDTQILSCSTGIMLALITGLQSFLAVPKTGETNASN
jgi:O-antigen ligase